MRAIFRDLKEGRGEKDKWISCGSRGHICSGCGKAWRNYFELDIECSYKIQSHPEPQLCGDDPNSGKGRPYLISNVPLDFKNPRFCETRNSLFSNPQSPIYSVGYLECGGSFSIYHFCRMGRGRVPKALPFCAVSVKPTQSTQVLQFSILAILANKATPLRYKYF